MQTYDVAVIGAGVFGSWTAYWLGKEGKSVALVDAYGPANARASSGGESRVIRMAYGSGEVYTRFSARSLALWKMLFEETGKPLFHNAGVLWMGPPDDPEIGASRAVFQQKGISFEELTAEEIGYRYPQIHLDGPVAGVFEPSSGALLARRAVHAVVSAARATLLTQRIEPVAGHGRLELGIRAATYVFACGPWLPKVIPDLLGNRIFPSRQEVLFFGVPAGDLRFSQPALPVWLDRTDQRIPYGFPDLEYRGFKIAFDRHGPAFDPDTSDRRIGAELVEQTRAYVARRFPGLAGAPLVESRVCQYENTSNGDFLIDRHPDFDNVWIAGGGSGHGFKHGPAVGEYVANRMAGRVAAEPRFSLESKQTQQRRQVF